MLLKNHTSKLMSLTLSLLFIACAERPVYEPAPKSVANGQQKTGTSNAGTADSSNGKTADAGAATPKNETPPAVNPTPTPTPAAPPPAAAAEPLGVAATGRTLLTANCIAAGCHGSTPLDAKTEVALANGTAILAHPQALKDMGFFVRPAAGSQPTNYSHVLAYLKANAAPIMGPNIP